MPLLFSECGSSDNLTAAAATEVIAAVALDLQGLATLADTGAVPAMLPLLRPKHGTSHSLVRVLRNARRQPWLAVPHALAMQAKRFAVQALASLAGLPDVQSTLRRAGILG